MNFLNGYKSYILGGITILIGLAELLGVDIVPSVDQASAFNYIMVGFGIVAGKSALAKAGSGQ